MAMPLTQRNAQICQGCRDCEKGIECRYIKRNIKIKFENPVFIRPQIPISPKNSFLNLETIRQRINNGEKAIDLSKEYGVAHGSFGCLLQRNNIKKPESAKFINDRIRAGNRARQIDEKGIIGNCNRCGVHGKLIRHHPDYDDCYMIEYICHRCHVIEHIKDKGKTYIPLSREAKAVRLVMLVKKYGPQIAGIFMHFYSFPNMKQTHLARLANISRERVRQILIQLHGSNP